MDIERIREPLIAFHDLANIDERYTLYYDETNNVRRLHLEEGRLNVPAPKPFVVGGVGYLGPPQPLGFDELRDLLSLQKSTNELKLTHLGKGDFIALLNSTRLGVLLTWLEGRAAFLHFQALDPLYWAVVDIIDSIIAGADAIQLAPMALDLKNDLYRLLRDDWASAVNLLSSYGYPDVGPRLKSSFVDDLLEALERQRPTFEHFNFQMLKGVLQLGKRAASLPFLEDETPNVLIDGFAEFYMHRLALFQNATHILDEESVVQERLASMNLMLGGRPLTTFTFVDSKTDPWVQVSDVMVGLVGKLLAFAIETDEEDVDEVLEALSQRQLQNLRKLSCLIDRSIEQSAGLVGHVMSLDDREIAARILAA